MDSGVPSEVQWQLLLGMIQKDDELLHGVLIWPGGKQRIAEVWSQMASKLNSIDGATAQKTGDQWKSAWNSLKSRARKAYRQQAQPFMEAGKEPPGVELLNLFPLYAQVINLTGVQNALGNLVKPATGAPKEASKWSRGPTEKKLPVPLQCSAVQQKIVGDPSAPQAERVVGTPPHWGTASGLAVLLPSQNHHAGSSNVDNTIALGKVLHTPPRASGLTPQAKRRGGTCEKGQGKDAKEKLLLVLEHHTNAMRDLIKTIKDMQMK